MTEKEGAIIGEGEPRVRVGGRACELPGLQGRSGPASTAVRGAIDANLEAFSFCRQRHGGGHQTGGVARVDHQERFYVGVLLIHADSDIRSSAHFLAAETSRKCQEDKSESCVTACWESSCSLESLSAGFMGHGSPFSGDEKSGRCVKPRLEHS